MSSNNDRLSLQFSENLIPLTGLSNTDLYRLYVPEKSNFCLIKQKLWSKKDNDYKPETTILTLVFHSDLGFTYAGSCGKLDRDKVTDSIASIPYEKAPIVHFLNGYAKAIVQSNQISGAGIKQLDEDNNLKALEDHCLDFASRLGRDHLEFIAMYLQSIKDKECRKLAGKLSKILNALPDDQTQSAKYDDNLFYLVNNDGSVVSSDSKASKLKAGEGQKVVKGLVLNQAFSQSV